MSSTLVSTHCPPLDVCSKSKWIRLVPARMKTFHCPLFTALTYFVVFKTFLNVFNGVRTARFEIPLQLNLVSLVNREDPACKRLMGFRPFAFLTRRLAVRYTDSFSCMRLCLICTKGGFCTDFCTDLDSCRPWNGTDFGVLLPRCRLLLVWICWHLFQNTLQVDACHPFLIPDSLQSGYLHSRCVAWMS